MVLAHEFLPQRYLLAWCCCIHAKDEFTRSDEAFWGAMTLKAPLHLQGSGLPHEWHLIDPTVTRDTPYPFFQVYAVIEADEIGQVVDPGPHEPLVVAITRPYWLEHGTISPNLGMTVHASFGRRDAGKGRLFHRRMTVTTIKAETADVMLVAERDRLGARHAHLGDVGGAIDRQQKPQERGDKQDATKDAQSGQGIGARMEYLGHAKICSADDTGNVLRYDGTPRSCWASESTVRGQAEAGRPCPGSSVKNFIQTILRRATFFT